MTELFSMILTLGQDIKSIKNYIFSIQKSALNQLTDKWIDGQVVIQSLHISKRTLQSLRDSGVLPYSRINGKFYYKVSDIEELLDSNYSFTTKKQRDDK